MKFKVVTLDLNGTLLPDTNSFRQILTSPDQSAFLDACDARLKAGQTTNETGFAEQWEMFRTLTPQEIHRALRKAAWLPGIGAGIARLRAAGLRVRLLTDQPSTVTDFAGRWGCQPAISSPVAVKEGEQISIDYRADKLANLRAAGLAPEQICHVGNGDNDVPIWRAGAHGIAVFADPEVASEAALDLGRPESFGAIVDAVLSAAGNTNQQ